ncbi:MAG: FecR domain-containing protein [Alistipes communis]
MKTDKINRLVRDFLHGDMPEEIQRRFRRWMTAPADRETKDAALFQAWKELLARPAERDYRHKLPDIHHRIDMLDRAGKKSRFISLRRFAAAAALLALVVCGEYLFLRSRYERAPSVCLVTARGSKSEFTLPDGTRVWLNGDSRLSYPETFDAGIRRVRLDGEAFFRSGTMPPIPSSSIWRSCRSRYSVRSSTPVTGPVLAMPKRSFNRAASVS